MHSYDLSPSDCSLFILIITTLVFTNLQTSVLSQDDEQYRACENTQSFDCADKRDLRYPFWSNDKPEFCGHPMFELNCSGAAPEITVESVTYRVLDVNPNARILRLARADLWDNPCPEEFRSTTFDTTYFEFVSGTQNLTMYYKCSEVSALTASIPNRFSCAGDGSDVTNIYAIESISDDNESCGASMTISISGSSVTSSETTTPNLNAALVSGFEIEWKANDSACEECVRSDGVCGSNTETEAFTCYCEEGPSSSVCQSGSPDESSNRSSSIVNVPIVIGAAVLGIIVFCSAVICCYKRKCISSQRIVIWKTKSNDEFDVEKFMGNWGSMAPKRYSYANVKNMTNSFSEKIGEGGFGAVYKGKLPEDCLVAVKLLNETKIDGEEFINEVASIGRTSHVNIVTLLGFCYERNKRALIYEYMPNGSLDKFIFTEESSNTNCRLEWKTLYQIAVGIARGLEYLHRGCNTRILHLDIKPQNILLDKDLCPKISDFGLAKLWLRKESIVSMEGARGTIGYIAPEVFSRHYGGVSHKSDVYSYGMLVLEMVGGRKNFDAGVSHASEIYYPNKLFKDLELGNEIGVLGKGTEEEQELSNRMLIVSFWCIQTNPSDRPSMSKVIDMLEGSFDSLEIPPKPCLFSPTRSP